jgi:DUF1680 family protein
VIDQISREAPLIPGSYVELKRRWKSGDVIELALDLAPTVWEASPLVEETTGQIAVRCGPLVYCLESNDLPAGVRLTDVALSSDAQQRRFTARRTRIANVDVVALSVPALEIRRAHSGPEPLYREIDPAPPRAIAVTLVPYFAWGNRGDTDMTVWLPLR